MILLVLGMIANSTAQKRNGFGIHAGTNAAGLYTITDGYLDGLDPLNGYESGIRYNLKFGPIGLCSELNYSVINYNYGPITAQDLIFATDPVSGNIISGPLTESGGQVTLNYISFPVLLKFYIGGLNIHLGAQSSYLFGGETTTNNGETTLNTDDSQYLDVNGTETWKWNEMDVAAVFGLGIDTKMGVYASVRSTISITPLANLDLFNAYISTPFGEDDLARLITSSFSVGYNF